MPADPVEYRDKQQFRVLPAPVIDADHVVLVHGSGRAMQVVIVPHDQGLILKGPSGKT